VMNVEYSTERAAMPQHPPTPEQVSKLLKAGASIYLLSIENSYPLRAGWVVGFMGACGVCVCGVCVWRVCVNGAPFPLRRGRDSLAYAKRRLN